MPPSPRLKARSRAEILSAAGLLFRRDGYQQVGIDAVMAQAGLTRGTFYAHFESKAALLVAILDGPHALIDDLNAIEDDEWRRSRGIDTLKRYVSPATFTHNRLNCSIAALGPDAARIGGVDDAWRALMARLRRALAWGLECADDDLMVDRAHLLSVATLMLARTLADTQARPLLLSAQDGLDDLPRFL